MLASDWSIHDHVITSRPIKIWTKQGLVAVPLVCLRGGLGDPTQKKEAPSADFAPLFWKRLEAGFFHKFLATFFVIF